MADDNVLNDPGLMDPSTEFGSMMQHAIKLKGAQMEAERRRFDSWPEFFQSTMWMRGEPLELRKLPLKQRLPAAVAIKERGNAHFREKHFEQAIESYEQALGSFRYAKQLDPDWKKKGIRDETIELVDDLADADAKNGDAKASDATADAEARAAAAEFCVSCYNNLAACYLGRASAGTPPPGGSVAADYALCVAACTAALELRPDCAKALYRRARARTEPASSDASAIDHAIADLAEAARASPDDRAVRALLHKMRADKLAHKSKQSSTFSGMFGRGEIYDAKSLEEQMCRMNAEVASRLEAEKRRTMADCEREALEAEEIVRSLHARGKIAEATQLASKIEEHRQQLADFKRAAESEAAARKTRQPRHIDFRHPTAQQVEDAKKHGVDLYDPVVVEELERLQREKAGGAEGRRARMRRRLAGARRGAIDDDDDDDDSDEDAYGSDGDGDGGGGGGRLRSRRPVRHRCRRPPPPDVSKIPLHEMRRRLDDMGVSHADCADRAALEARLLAQYTHGGGGGGDDDDDDDDDDEHGWGIFAALDRWGCAIL